MTEFVKAYEKVLDKIARAIKSIDFSKAKEYSSDLISTSYVMNNKYALLISEFLYTAFDDLEYVERSMRRRFLPRFPRVKQETLEPVENVRNDLKNLTESFEVLQDDVVKFLFDTQNKDRRSTLIESMADFLIKVKEITDKYEIGGEL